jgi:hypothetical protein
MVFRNKNAEHSFTGASLSFTSIRLLVSFFVFCLRIFGFFHVSFSALRRPEWLLIIVAVHDRDGLLLLQIEPADQIHAGCATGEITCRENCRSAIFSLYYSTRFFLLSIRLVRLVSKATRRFCDQNFSFVLKVSIKVLISLNDLYLNILFFYVN